MSSEILDRFDGDHETAAAVIGAFLDGLPVLMADVLGTAAGAADMATATPLSGALEAEMARLQPLLETVRRTLEA